jgi:hypothetical protein
MLLTLRILKNNKYKRDLKEYKRERKRRRREGREGHPDRIPFGKRWNDVTSPGLLPSFAPQQHNKHLTSSTAVLYDVALLLSYIPLSCCSL